MAKFIQTSEDEKEVWDSWNHGQAWIVSLML